MEEVIGFEDAFRNDLADHHRHIDVWEESGQENGRCIVCLCGRPCSLKKLSYMLFENRVIHVSTRLACSGCLLIVLQFHFSSTLVYAR